MAGKKKDEKTKQYVDFLTDEENQDLDILSPHEADESAVDFNLESDSVHIDFSFEEEPTEEHKITGPRTFLADELGIETKTIANQKNPIVDSAEDNEKPVEVELSGEEEAISSDEDFNFQDSSFHKDKDLDVDVGGDFAYDDFVAVLDGSSSDKAEELLKKTEENMASEHEEEQKVAKVEDKTAASLSPSNDEPVAVSSSINTNLADIQKDYATSKIQKPKAKEVSKATSLDDFSVVKEDEEEVTAFKYQLEAGEADVPVAQALKKVAEFDPEKTDPVGMTAEEASRKIGSQNLSEKEENTPKSFEYETAAVEKPVEKTETKLEDSLSGKGDEEKGAAFSQDWKTEIKHRASSNANSVNKNLDDYSSTNIEKGAIELVNSASGFEIKGDIQSSENLRLAQDKILQLEAELERFRLENQELAAAGHVLKRKLNEQDNQRIHLDKTKQEVELQLKEEVEHSQLRIQAKNQEISELRVKVESLELRLQRDLQRVRSRERELENRLEIIRLENSAVLRSKDEHILELKRKLDQKDIETEQLAERLKKQVDESKEKHDKIKRTVRTLRLALNMLDEADGEKAENKNKKTA